METKLQILQDFIAEHNVNLSFYFSIGILNNVSLMGYINRDSMLFAQQFASPKITAAGHIEFTFQYKEAEFQLIFC